MDLLLLALDLLRRRRGGEQRKCGDDLELEHDWSEAAAGDKAQEKAAAAMEKDGNTAGIPLAVFIEDPADFLKILPDDDTADSTAKLDQVRAF